MAQGWGSFRERLQIAIAEALCACPNPTRPGHLTPCAPAKITRTKTRTPPTRPGLPRPSRASGSRGSTAAQRRGAALAAFSLRRFVTQIPLWLLFVPSIVSHYQNRIPKSCETCCIYDICREVFVDRYLQVFER